MKERRWKQEIPLLVDNFPFPIRPLCSPTEQADPSKGRLISSSPRVRSDNEHLLCLIIGRRGSFLGCCSKNLALLTVRFPLTSYTMFTARSVAVPFHPAISLPDSQDLFKPQMSMMMQVLFWCSLVKLKNPSFVTSYYPCFFYYFAFLLLLSLLF